MNGKDWIYFIIGFVMVCVAFGPLAAGGVVLLCVLLRWVLHNNNQPPAS